MVDETAAFRHVAEGVDSPVVPQRVDGALDWIRRSEGTLRIAHWNVSDDSFREHGEDFARVLATVDADVLTLSELPGDVTDDEVRAFLERAPLGARGAWTFTLGASGGRQRAVVASRDMPLEVVPALSDVRYNTDALDRLWEAVPPAMRPAIDLERSRGVSTVGAWLETTRGRFLVVALDLQSGGWVGSGQDQLRALQARTIRARIDEALADSQVPVIIGGDLNLVGSREPLVVLTATPDGRGENLVPVEARRLGERTLTTWRNPAQRFTPGRLDYILVAPQAADVARGFSFASDDLDAATLESLELEGDLSAGLSDHLVVVADLRLR